MQIREGVFFSLLPVGDRRIILYIQDGCMEELQGKFHDFFYKALGCEQRFDGRDAGGQLRVSGMIA
jgi:hypothetical protein